MRERRVARGRGDWNCCCRRVPQSVLRVFFFLRKSSCSVLLLHTRKGPLAQPTSPARPGTAWVRAQQGPTLNSPQLAHIVSLCVPVPPYSPPWDFKQPGVSWCCSSPVWQGREPLTWLSPRSPAAGLAGAGLGLMMTFKRLFNTYAKLGWQKIF